MIYLYLFGTCFHFIYVFMIISNIVPARWFISASRKIMIEGVGMEYVLTEIRALAIEGVVFMLLAWRFFKARLA